MASTDQFLFPDTLPTSNNGDGYYMAGPAENQVKTMRQKYVWVHVLGRNTWEVTYKGCSDKQLKDMLTAIHNQWSDMIFYVMVAPELINVDNAQHLPGDYHIVIFQRKHNPIVPGTRDYLISVLNDLMFEHTPLDGEFSLDEPKNKS